MLPAAARRLLDDEIREIDPGDLGLADGLVEAIHDLLAQQDLAFQGAQILEVLEDRSMSRASRILALLFPSSSGLLVTSTSSTTLR